MHLTCERVRFSVFQLDSKRGRRDYREAVIEDRVEDYGRHRDAPNVPKGSGRCTRAHACDKLEDGPLHGARGIEKGEESSPNCRKVES